MKLYELRVVSEPEQAVGFQLAGLEVDTVFKPETARFTITQLINNPQVGILAITDKIKSYLNPKWANLISQLDQPVVLFLPPISAKPQELWQKEMQQLIASAIGLSLTLEKES